MILLLEALVGSRAYGTATEDSDIDRRIVFAHKTREMLSVDDRGNSIAKDTVWEETPGDDVTGWEVGKFVKMALSCNPTALEVLWAPAIHVDLWGERLRYLRRAFLSRDRVYEAFSGYASNQAKKMLNEPGAGLWTVRNWKFAEAYLRALYQGLMLLTTGELPIDMQNVRSVFGDETAGNELLRAKRGEMSKSAVVDQADMLERRLRAASLLGDVPVRADLTAVNTFLVALRLAMW